MIPASGFVAPPPNGLGPPRRRERSSMLVCVEASQHALHVYTYIHTDYTYTHTYIHTYMHACTYRHALQPTGGGEDHLSPVHTKNLCTQTLSRGGVGACRPGP